MKKLVALFLVCALCLGLAACESQEEKAAKQAMTDADALMESGDYASALEALGQSTLDGAACTYAIGTNLTITGLEEDITLLP